MYGVSFGFRTAGSSSFLVINPTDGLHKSGARRNEDSLSSQAPIPQTCHADPRVRLQESRTMKVTVELSDNEMAEILDLTGERKKGPAIRRLMEEALQQRRRAQIAQRFLSGEWGVELETYEADQKRERQRDLEFAI